MKAKYCISFWSKFRGLMFSNKKNLLFVFDNEERRGLHMFFVFFPINVIFLNKDFIIKEIISFSSLSFKS